MTSAPFLRITLAPDSTADTAHSLLTLPGQQRPPLKDTHASQPSQPLDAPVQEDDAHAPTPPGQSSAPQAAVHGIAIALHHYAAETLAQAIYLSGVVTPPPLCSGIGHCGQCRVRFLSEPPTPLPEDTAFFPDEALTAGWRLACHHPCAAGMRVALPPSARLTEQALRQFSGMAAPPEAELTAPYPGNNTGAITPPGDASPGPLPRVASSLPAGLSPVPGGCAPERTARTLPVGCGLAFDIGTTSLHCRLTDAAGQTLWETARINPQMGAGSDVISRLAAARHPQGAARLHNITLDALRELAAAASVHGIIGTACLAANPAMTALALGLETASLARAPYSLPHTGGIWEHLDGLPRLWIPPQISPFVGGDISAGYAALRAQPAPPSFPFLLADLGTNGELLLALSPSEAVGTSVALGPALEGIGLACGTLAGPGAITGFHLTPQGLQAVFYEEAPPHAVADRAAPGLPAHAQEGPVPQGRESPGSPPGTAERHAVPAPCGITATGYLSLLLCLLTSHALQRDGHYTPERSPLLQRFFQRSAEAPCPCPRCRGAEPPLRRRPSGEPWVPLPHNLHATATDIEEILKVKAAFSLGLALLLETARVPAHSLTAIYVAGALGAHVTPASLENLGFFPPGLERRIVIAGNTALQGAALLARDAKARHDLVAWAKNAAALDLANTPAFTEGFPSHMRFMW